ncbi:MAG: hypothetical protein EB150_00645 [Nitrososphaeria archaeon]|nr:hypothetical protein [Nitrososphaeria archaeon]NDB52039.1 hypothetical protein [Nitrosopumilaceae archaeon]NDB92108.1 hypothetical protein [Nitrososphaeria archaeon]NDF27632.1 hypothetical protein [Nitrosopumilaceae archaeon]NDF28712.1 hypothetical protein [Nitrososphaeria archaeon]
MDVIQQLIPWICVWVIESVIGIVFLIMIRYKDPIASKYRRNVVRIGLSIVAISTIIYLASNAVSFSEDRWHDDCVKIQNNQELVNKTKFVDCMSDKQEDLKMTMFVIGTVTTVLILIGNLMVELGHRR